MIQIESILGNIFKDNTLKKKYDDMKIRKLLEVITISRTESQRVRMRKTSDKGTDIGLNLQKGSKLRHGDVIMDAEDKMITIEIAPEMVIEVKVKENLPRDHMIEIPVRVGHTIGNLHRPLKLEDDKVYFPIQTEDEVNTFKTLFAPIVDHLEIKKTEIVFEPEEGMDIHEH